MAARFVCGLYRHLRPWGDCIPGLIVFWVMSHWLNCVLSHESLVELCPESLIELCHVSWVIDCVLSHWLNCVMCHVSLIVSSAMNHWLCPQSLVMSHWLCPQAWQEHNLRRDTSRWNLNVPLLNCMRMEQSDTKAWHSISPSSLP